MTFVDDTGRTVSLPRPPQRIISLAPSVSENLFAIGAGGLVVGVTTADDYPPAVARLPRIGNFYQPLVEKIRALRPDLVVVESGTVHRADMDNLANRLQAPVYAQNSRRFSDVARQLLRLGEMTGHAAQARPVAAAFSAKAARVARRIQGQRPVSVFVQIDLTALYAAGPGSFIDDLIRLAGGINVVRGSNPFPLVSKEAVIAGDPAVYIFTVPAGPNVALPSPPPVDPALREIAAVRNRRVYGINADLLSRPAPRLADGLTLLAKLLHP